MISEYQHILENAFDVLNSVYYENKLPKAVITIQSKSKAYGYITSTKVWTDDNNSFYEINISAEYLNRPIEQVFATLQHEMVHLYCIINNIADTSKSGRYHNKNFKVEAEKRDLLIEYAKYIGYSKTMPSDKFIKTLCKYGFMDKSIEHHRCNSNSSPTLPKKKSSTRKYKCPVCGISVRATKEVNLICGDCLNTLEHIES